MKHRVVLREMLHRQLKDHLLSGLRCNEMQEEVCFALWHQADGFNRYTGVIYDIILPEDGDRDLHSNVTVQGRYLNRILDQALKNHAGIAVIHSHLSHGWQDLSNIDDNAERNIIAPFVRETGLPLLGLTIGSDGVWSARFWHESEYGQFTRVHCSDVRRVGPRNTQADWNPKAYPHYDRRPSLVRTIDSWGIKTQAKLARTHVCVVGAGSVGSIVLEYLARIGIEEITIIDPDFVEDRNLDRLIYADRHCLKLPKVEVATAHIRRITTARHPIIRPVPLSIRTKQAYSLASDADMIVCCVDNAEARDVLNHIAYANCLPLIDGGVLVESGDRLLSAKWRVHLVGPDMQCLRCRGQYTSNDARDEREGIRHHGRYINDGLTDGPEPGQNTIAFCSGVASEQVRMLVRYLISEDWWHDDAATTGLWAFEHRFVEAKTEPFEHPSRCKSSCEFANKRLGLGKRGRPQYAFVEEPRYDWKVGTMRRYRQFRMRIGRAIVSLCT